MSPGVVFSCGNCKVMRYVCNLSLSLLTHPKCSRACQTKDWPSHKKSFINASGEYSMHSDQNLTAAMKKELMHQNQLVTAWVVEFKEYMIHCASDCVRLAAKATTTDRKLFVVFHLKYRGAAEAKKLTTTFTVTGMKAVPYAELDSDSKVLVYLPFNFQEYYSGCKITNVGRHSGLAQKLLDGGR